MENSTILVGDNLMYKTVNYKSLRFWCKMSYLAAQGVKLIIFSPNRRVKDRYFKPEQGKNKDSSLNCKSVQGFRHKDIYLQEFPVKRRGSKQGHF